MSDKEIDSPSQLVISDYTTPVMLSLPPEVQGMIASFVRVIWGHELRITDFIANEDSGQLLRPTDLNALSRTCKALRDTSLPKLYRRVNVRIPAGHSRLDALENLLLSDGEGLKSTQQLHILPQQVPIQFPLHDGGHINLDTHGHVARSLKFHPGNHVSNLLNILIRQLIMKIPLHCLIVFEWRHTCPMHETTLALLLERQQPLSLRLEGFTVDLTRSAVKIPTTLNIEELRFRSLEPVQIVGWMGNLVATNLTTLRHLEIGAENKVGECRRNNAFYNDSDPNFQLTKKFRQKLETCLVDVHGPSYPVLSLSSLTLVGLSLLDLEDSDGRPIIDWNNLKALAIKSCSRLDGTLAFLQSAIVKPVGSGEVVKLKSFDLRSDNRVNTPNTAIVLDALKNFLTSFNGLVHLGLLLEDRNVSVSMFAAILEKHGPTLRRLIWDVRLQERTSFTKDLSRAQTGNAHVAWIFKWCPMLEELGLSLDWTALMEPRGKGTLIKVAQYLKSRKRLRTLHIRNLPSLRQEDGEPSWPGVSDDERSEGFVTKLVRALVRGRLEQPPILETIALGVTRYKDICAGIASPHDNERLDEFLKLRVYHVEYRRNFEGDCVPIVTLIAKGTTDALKGIRFNINILHSYWMG